MRSGKRSSTVLLEVLREWCSQHKSTSYCDTESNVSLLTTEVLKQVPAYACSDSVTVEESKGRVHFVFDSNIWLLRMTMWLYELSTSGTAEVGYRRR